MKMRLITTLLMTLMLTVTLALPAVAADEQSRDASVTVTAPETLISITLTDPGSPGIQFGSIPPSGTVIPAEGQSDGTPAIQVNVAIETNVQVDINIMGSTTDALTLDNWMYSKTFVEVPFSLTSSYVPVYTDVTAGDSKPFYHWIIVPVGTTAGAYSASISYKATTHIP